MIPYVSGSWPVSDSGEWLGRYPRVAFVSEYPGKEEVRSGRSLSGPSGQILWQLAWREMGLRAEDCGVTNLVKEPQRKEWERKGIPEEVLAQYGRDLEGELELGQPELIVALGRYATRHFLGDWATMEIVNGTIHEIERPWGTVAVVPAIHTAAAMRSPDRLAFTQEALALAGRIVKGERIRPVSPMKQPKIFTSWAEYHRLHLEFYDCLPELMVGMDTEYDPLTGEPWGLSFAIDPHHALVLRAGDRTGLAGLRRWLDRQRPRVALHYAMADLEPLRQMGIDLLGWGLELVDTNILAFHQQTLPKALKPLCRRLLGLEMRDYEDVVNPYHFRQLAAWFELACELTAPGIVQRWSAARYRNPTAAQLRRAEKAGLPAPLPVLLPGKRLKDAVESSTREHRLVKRALVDWQKDPTTDLWKRWEGWDAEPRAELESLLGPVPKAGLHLVPDVEAEAYSGADAAGTVGLVPILEAMHGRAPLIEQAFDYPRIPQIDEMQETGLNVDVAGARALNTYLIDQIAETREILQLITDDRDFNPDSADQVREKLFAYSKVAPGVMVFDPEEGDEWVLPVQKTKTGLPSTDKKSLALLKHTHYLPAYLLEYRGLKKLQSTYVGPLERWVDPRTGLLHPNYSVTRVPSGRLAASKPNLMAIPKRHPLAKKIRALFFAEEGWELASWDHGQIELRVMADDAGDEVMISELQPGADDMHRANAVMFFGLDADLRDEDYWRKGGDGDKCRECSKTITYCNGYGGGPDRMWFESMVAGFTMYDVDDFKRLQAEWWRKYRGIKARVEWVEQQCRETGVIHDRWGRPRKLPAVALTGPRWPMAKLREEGVRQGFNHTIQGGAQGFMARAQILAQQETFPALRRAGIEIKPLLQIHDELMVKYRTGPGHWERVNAAMTAAMTADSWMMAVPILTDAAHGRTWADL